MAVNESDRLEMHLGLRKVHGDKVAETIMEHLPPTGWGDVARKQDVLVLKEDLGRLRDEVDRLRDDMDRRFVDMDRRFVDVNRRVDGLTHAMWAMAGINSTAFIALFTLLATRG